VSIAGSDATSDRLALLDLSYAYARNADRIDAEALGQLFVDDGVLRVINRNAQTPPIERTGRNDIVSAIKRLDRYDMTFHMVGNHSFEIDGESATGEVYCIAHHVHGEPDSKRDHVMMIRYHDRYRHTPDGWRFAQRELHVDWTEERVVTS
jgi:sulfur relay (sulfurtransferase) DsrF/TusC family protein